jgi:hypothetical protein
MADRNPNIPIERVREHEEDKRKVYDERNERAGEKKAKLEEKATQHEEPPPVGQDKDEKPMPEQGGYSDS